VRTPTRIVRRLDALDRMAYAAAARAHVPVLDDVLRRLSRAADHALLWHAIAGTLAIAGGPRGRRAATTGVASIAVASATVNLAIKAVGRRRRPDRIDVPIVRHVPMPASYSFPSGHAASAFAFATAAGRALPAVAVPLRLLAAAVAYSRVHTGVHYPGDVLAGVLVGAATGRFVAAKAATPRGARCRTRRGPRWRPR
jgi:undecaprenyl-diphosphatase